MAKKDHMVEIIDESQQEEVWMQIMECYLHDY
jgi:hypothetical protein